MATEKPFRAEMGPPPPNVEDAKTAPPPSDKGVFTVEKIGKTKTPKGEKLPRDLMPKDLPSAKKYAAGGSASSRADGCAMRGKTKGRMV